MKQTERLKDLFYFHESARRGILWLLILFLLSIAFRYVVSIVVRPTTTDNLEVYKNWMLAAQQSEVSIEEVDTTSAIKFPSHYESRQDDDLTTIFHPDTASLETWIRSGLNKGQARTVIKYLAAGGKLRTKKDLKKIKVIDMSTFDRVSPLLDLPDSLSWNQNNSDSPIGKWETSIAVIDINAADTSHWKTLPGIGSYFARKIVEYRDQLGGYQGIEQISEVRGLKPETFQKIKVYLQITPGSWDKIDINGFDEKNFSHPYLNRTQIKTLAAWREKHGPYTSVEQVQKAAMLTEDEIRRLLPYLPF